MASRSSPWPPTASPARGSTCPRCPAPGSSSSPTARRVLGLNALWLGAAVLVGLLLGSVERLRLEPPTAAATAVVVLPTGYSGNGGMLLSRLAETTVGAAVGLLINLLVWPPLRDR